jgi:3-oxoacyl-[acyl-carrier-protein] synthase II
MAAVASSAVFGARHVMAPRRVTSRVSSSRVTARATRVATVTRAMARETDPKKRIVVTGMGLCSVFGNDYDVFYDKLLAGVSGVSEIDRFDIGEFPTKFAAQIREFDNEGFIDKKNARRMDPVLQYALVSGNKALLDAGLDAPALAKVDLTKIGVLAGSGMGGLTVFQDGVKALVDKGPKKITPFFIPCKYCISQIQRLFDHAKLTLFCKTQRRHHQHGRRASGD